MGRDAIIREGSLSSNSLERKLGTTAGDRVRIETPGGGGYGSDEVPSQARQSSKRTAQASLIRRLGRWLTAAQGRSHSTLMAIAG